MGLPLCTGGGTVTRLTAGQHILVQIQARCSLLLFYKYFTVVFAFC